MDAPFLPVRNTLKYEIKIRVRRLLVRLPPDSPPPSPPPTPPSEPSSDDDVPPQHPKCRRRTPRQGARTRRQETPQPPVVQGSDDLLARGFQRTDTMSERRSSPAGPTKTPTPIKGLQSELNEAPMVPRLMARSTRLNTTHYYGGTRTQLVAGDS